MPELTSREWAEIEELFERALELGSDARTDFLSRECSNPNVRGEIESLLSHAGVGFTGGGLAKAEEAIASAASAVADEADPDARLLGARLGPYKVVSIAGHGGMGAVYRARRDDNEFQQQVAIKLVRAAAQSNLAQQRFRQERQILARLSHPNIACLLDGGSTPEGIPYLVMEFIEGEPITAWCERNKLSVEQRIRIFLPVCDAVEAANRGNVIHRDLKPANIQVNLEGVPKLLDFGIAKLVDPDDIGPTFATRLQAMTPDYASPEQIRGGRVTAATDVYALGLVLYEILTGQKAQQLPDRTPHTLVRVICQEEPIRPAALRPQLSGDLDHIIRQAIRKEPERRYRTAADLRNDLDNYLAGRPVSARADTLTYRTGKFLSRNRTAAKAGATTATFVIAALMTSYWLSRPARPPRVLQVIQLTHSGHVSFDDRMVTDGTSLYFTEESGGRTTLARVSVNGGTPEPIPVSEAPPDLSILDLSPDFSRLLVTSDHNAENAPSAMTVSSAGGSLTALRGVRTHSASWSRDSRHIFFISGSGLFRINPDGTDRRKLRDLPQGSGGLRTSPGAPESIRLSLFARDMRSSDLWQFAPDGSGAHHLLTGPEFASGRPDVYYSGDWSASGNYYFFRARENSMTTFWALRERRGFLARSDRRPVAIYSTPLRNRWIVPSLDGKRLFFTASQDQLELVRYSRKRNEFLPFLSDVPGSQAAVSKDGNKVAFTVSPQDILWTSGIDGGGRVQLTKPPLRVFNPLWSPDGKSIAFTGTDSGQPTRVYVIPATGGEARIIGSAPFEQNRGWSADGKRILVERGPPPGYGGQAGLFVLDVKTNAMERLPGFEPSFPAAWSPDDRYVASGAKSAGIMLFDFHTRRWKTLVQTGPVGTIVWSRDAKYVFYQTLRSSDKMPIFRVRIADGKVERVTDWRQIPQANVSSYSLLGLVGDDEPIAAVSRSNCDIYGMDLDLP